MVYGTTDQLTLWIITATRGHSQPARERERTKLDDAPFSPSHPPYVTAISLNGALCKMKMILASGGVMGRMRVNVGEKRKKMGIL